MQTTRKPAPGSAEPKPMTEEADIGSGEKTPAQLDTEEIIRQIPPLPPSNSDKGGGTKPGAGQAQGG